MNRMMLAVALAAAGASQASTVKVLGWTPDRCCFVYLAHDSDEESETPDQVVVVDTVTGGQRTFDETNQASLAALGALTGLPGSRTSDDGTATAEVLLSESGSAGSWSGGTWSAGGADAWRFSVTKGKKTYSSASSGSASSVDVYFSPDGRNAAWVVHYKGQSMRDTGEDVVLVGIAGATAVQIVIEKSRLAEGRALAATLLKAGVQVRNVSPALAAREKTVVYAGADWQEEAAAVARLLPGSTVAKLDWYAPFDIVVAVGAPKKK